MSINMYALLPEFTGPNMLPPARMKHFRDNIRPNMNYCGLSFLTRLIAWCKYIKEWDAKMSNNVSTGLNLSDPRSLAASSLGGMYGTCYDAYNCDVPELAPAMHSISVAASLLVILGLISNLYCLIKISLAHNRPELARPPFGTFLICLILADCCALLLSLPLFLMSYLGGQTHASQLKVYQKSTACVTPIILPLYDFSRLLAIWLTVSLLVQRSNTTIARLQMEAFGVPQGLSQNPKGTTRTTIKQLMAIHIGLLLLCVPKFAEYTFNENFITGKRIIVPLLRVFRIYRMIMLKLVYPSIECVVPILLMLAYIAVIKYHEIVLTRSRFEKTGNNESAIEDNPKNVNEAGISTIIGDDCGEDNVDNYSRELLGNNANSKSIPYNSSYSSNLGNHLSIVPTHNRNNNSNKITTYIYNYSGDLLTTAATTDNFATTTCITFNPNQNTAIVFSVAGVSRRTQLVMWSSTALILALVIQLAAGIVSLEQRLEGSPREQWPKLRQGIRLLGILAWLLVCSVKPIIYIHCCPRLLRKDLSLHTHPAATAFFCQQRAITAATATNSDRNATTVNQNVTQPLLNHKTPADISNSKTTANNTQNREASGEQDSLIEEP